MAKKFSKLSKKELRCIAKLEKQRNETTVKTFDKHYTFIQKYCIKHGLRTLSFRRGKRGNPNAINITCETFSFLEFLTPFQRKELQKQLEELK